MPVLQLDTNTHTTAMGLCEEAKAGTLILTWHLLPGDRFPREHARPTWAGHGAERHGHKVLP